MKGARRVTLALLVIVGVAWVFLTNPVLPETAHPFANGAQPATLSAHVGFLAALDPPRGHPRGMLAAASYVKHELEALGLHVESQPVSVAGYEFPNLIVSFGPEGGERIVVGAHYDCYGRNPGADDNGSGTAGLLELARLLKERAPALKYGVDLVAFSTEEPPYFATEEMGSAVHAKSLREHGVKLRYMVSLEMIGDFSDAAHSQDYPMPILRLFYPSRGNFVALVGGPGEWSLVRDLKTKMQETTSLPVYSINAPAMVPGLDWSDHRNYWHEGYRAVMVTDTSFYRNRRYHTREDTPERLDYKRMAEVVNAIYAAVTTP